ncbi:DUF998 domain-containing protein [Actinosynnema pretiosum subsp. pretiosum]|uniref:DUF998 domain-containing protein n=2 Tax=Actinosynnema TaxID=40566 RepID=C6W9M9_ACTMD|nr:DUF998 domain-containing protein [Actinosynnema mirum]ACU37246.1 hypothetical protein Amir_3344 [Actinosynnema mirum DSM 43827]AXX30713.1 hypothetical protein APASM_3348 [Actinosynnema pretiosum subsp. pretiosum]QUF05168.1 DUF998 domain-containing protein [Actinosynnema pretiosum subsp. pretiosum]
MIEDRASSRSGRPALDRPGAWLVAAAVLYACWLLELVLPTGLSVVDGYVSELLADDQPHRWLFRATDSLAACCVLLAARHLRGRWAVAAVLVFALATLADTALPLDCAPSTDRLCRDREAAGAVSLSHHLHQVTSVLTFVGALAAAAVLERGTRLPGARVVLILLAGTGVLSAVLVNQPGAGLVQRVQLLTVSAGLLLGARVSSRGAVRPGAGPPP